MGEEAAVLVSKMGFQVFLCWEFTTRAQDLKFEFCLRVRVAHKIKSSRQTTTMPPKSEIAMAFGKRVEGVKQEIDRANKGRAALESRGQDIA